MLYDYYGDLSHGLSSPTTEAKENSKQYNRNVIGDQVITTSAIKGQFVPLKIRSTH